MQKKILIVEDSQALAMAYSLPFVRKGFRVEITGDGRQALALVRNFVPDVVLLDLVLPKVRGSVILEAIRSAPLTQNLPVIVFTNSLLMPGEEVRLRRLANRFVHKAQTSPEQVLLMVEELLSPPAKDEPEALTPAPQAPSPSQPNPLAAPEVPASSCLKEEPAASVASKAKASPPDPRPAFPARPSSVAGHLPPSEVTGQATALPCAAALPADRWPEMEARLRKLQTEQKDELRTALLEKFTEQWRSLKTSFPPAGGSGLSRLTRVFDDLVTDVSQDPAHRTNSAYRALFQAWPVLKRLANLARTPEESWEPPLTRTLIVDDSTVSLKVIAKALEKIQLNCLPVANPIEAVGLLTAEPFDLVILDVDMPQMTGPQVCRKLRSIPRHVKTPVIFLTSLNRLDTRLATSSAGGNDFVAKPFHAPELAVKALTHILRRHLDAKQS
ncbi:MAG: response regulator [Verrucomicrobia bacterium]|nr:response regulator [Verrucomicrobiota bacterium]